VPQGKAGKAAIRAARRYAFGLIGEDELTKARAAVWAAGAAVYSAALVAADAAADSAAIAAADAAAWAASSEAWAASSAAYSAARAAQAARLHDYLLGKVDLDAIRDKVA
jgi:hypothetical protein